MCIALMLTNYFATCYTLFVDSECFIRPPAPAVSLNKSVTHVFFALSGEMQINERREMISESWKNFRARHHK